MEFEDSDYYTGPELTDEVIVDAERRLGYKLPDSYLDVLRVKNGGIPTKRRFRTPLGTGGAPGSIDIAAILGIGGKWGIEGTEGFGSAYMIKEWDYPDIGIVFCDMAYGAYDAVMLDYRDGAAEPAVVFVEEVSGGHGRVPRRIADTFAEFIAGLEVIDEDSLNSGEGGHL